MKTNLKALFVIGLLALAVSLSGQTAGNQVKPAAATKTASAVLEYFDDNKQLKIFNSDGFEYGDIFLGMELMAGDRIQTAKSVAELRLNPNGSIIKLAANTNFQITSFKSAGKGVNDFTLLVGKIRTVAAKSAGGIDYQFRTKTSVAAVRGTDFGMEVQEGISDRLIVRDGAVDFTQAATGKVVNVLAGMGADTFDADFAARQLKTQDMADFFKEMDFVRLNPATVPATAPTESGDASPQTNQTQDNPVGTTVPANPPADTAGGDQSKSGGNSLLNDPTMDLLKKYLGLEIGSVLIDGTTFGKLVAQPRIDTPDFKMQLYLPIIYQSNMFDAGTWYHPLGNNEWSFGTDQGNDALAIVWDVVRDLFLKIKYIELFKKSDPFYLAVGNIPSMTLGHGILIGGYANDADFPAIRRLGLDIGVDTGTIAIEGLVNDVASFDIYGARLLWRPVAPTYKVGAAISAAMDLNPAGSLPKGSLDPIVAGTVAAKPVFLNVAADIEIPIVQIDAFSMLLYGDFAGMLPYFTNGFSTMTGGTVNPGMQWGNLFTLSSDSIGIVMRNYGIEAGLMGKLFFVDYRLEFQYFTGSFQPSFYDQVYDRDRGQKAMALYQQFLSGTVDTTVRMGVYGRFGFDIANILYFAVGYKWPWNAIGGDIVPDDNPDYLTARLYFAKDALPYGIDFSIGMDREYIVPCITRPQSYAFFDQYAVFNGRLEVPIGNFFKLRLTVGTAAQRDSNGAVVLTGGKVVMMPTFGIESVF